MRFLGLQPLNSQSETEERCTGIQTSTLISLSFGLTQWTAQVQGLMTLRHASYKSHWHRRGAPGNILFPGLSGA
jgi:hypothetical protein